MQYNILHPRLANTVVHSPNGRTFLTVRPAAKSGTLGRHTPQPYPWCLIVSSQPSLGKSPLENLHMLSLFLLFFHLLASLFCFLTPKPSSPLLPDILFLIPGKLCSIKKPLDMHEPNLAQAIRWGSQGQKWLCITSPLHLHRFTGRKPVPNVIGRDSTTNDWWTLNTYYTQDTVPTDGQKWE